MSDWFVNYLIFRIYFAFYNYLPVTELRLVTDLNYLS